ncbi:hypothetical protein [uncultured Faecalibaculum sp.]|uniref:hypothetical protein n=1 Tax=uncultured Faecalibaculum sp. TaxID=1729681 RepID=UPI0025E2B502|nr:hypothetical protein [uncultured Faecalibaculum sp.]
MTSNTSRNGLFLVSAGCLFILLSCMMTQPVWLICSGILLVLWGGILLRRDRKKNGTGKDSR